MSIVFSPRWGLQTQAFYNEEINLLFVKVVPQRKPNRSLISEDARLAIGVTDDRHIESVEFICHKDDWVSECDLALPKGNISYGDIIFDEPVVDTPLDDPVPKCDAEGLYLKLEFPGLTPTKNVAVGDSLLLSLDENNQLCAIWVANIYIDFDGRKQKYLSFLKESDSLRPETS